MASIASRKDQDGNVIGWQARVIRKGFQCQTKTFRTKRDAQAWATHVESQLLARRDAMDVARTVGKRPIIGYLDDLDRDALTSAVSLLQGKAGQHGFVYIALSPALGWKQCKIGRTVNLNQRMRDLSRNTGVPEEFNAVYSKRFADATLAESVMHEVFSDQRMNARREFFAVPVQHAIEALDMLHEVMNGGRTH
ncbi:GIY-YIG nuclease family protein [Acidithiobacillus ferriphilus]|uniref:GIY-YIG nuclease family protein n=1 Tax=Acidithiobacillus ferriphilus TaxID=1689834 RepID=UPI001C07A5D1|nr:GIY-YIG nuclease family protein [Acidithiobacillus ferriphilus]MBU2845669.1 GIY-YIG nuclease family protein [Acidithiobacillus ferriphilus]